jgi:ATP-dependent Lon protease
MRHGIKIVVIPEKNKKDLEDIPAEYREKLEFIPVKNIDEVLDVVLVDKISEEVKGYKPPASGTPRKKPSGRGYDKAA